ncbi:MAG: AbrB/MazE/SpoVT family DNA-binding domain-containing protein [Armatimonadota bacterium]|nr:AbrB/MazE/SpoVT family DNA-binding domain-containing protein [Armatimonadota bacterium]
MATVTVSKKGWVVIPREIRQRYGIRPGDRVQVVDYAGRIAIIPAMKDPIREARGMLKRGPSLTEALLEERRQELKREQEEMQRWGARKEGS